METAILKHPIYFLKFTQCKSHTNSSTLNAPGWSSCPESIFPTCTLLPFPMGFFLLCPSVGGSEKWNAEPYSQPLFQWVLKKLETVLLTQGTLWGHEQEKELDMFSLERKAQGETCLRSSNIWMAIMQNKEQTYSLLLQRARLEPVDRNCRKADIG